MLNSSQTNGIGLTPKVQSLLKDQLEHEKLCVDKYTEYAAKAKDPQLAQLFTEIANCEQQHYDTIQTMLNGTIPSMGNSSSSGSSSNSSGMSGSTNSSSGTGSMSSTQSTMGGTSSTNSTSGTTSDSSMSSTSGSNSTTNTSYTNSSSSSTKNSSKNSYTNSKTAAKNKGKSQHYNYPPQSTLTASTKDYNEKQPATAQNPIMATDSIFSGYTGGGGLGSYVNQSDGNSLLRSYENTLDPGDLVVGSGGISYGSYGATAGGPSTKNTTSSSTGSSYGSSSQTTNSTSSNSTGMTSSSNSTGTTNSTSSSNTGMTSSTSSSMTSGTGTSSSMGSSTSGMTTGTTSGGMGGSNSVTDCDKKMCQDLLMTEKHISKNYDTTIFECPNKQMRSVLNHIQKEEQEHGDKLYNYMHQKGWY